MREINFIQEIVIPLGGVAAAVFLGILAFFLRRLIRSVDDMGAVLFKIFPIHQARVETISNQVSDLKTEVSSIRSKFDEVMSIRERVAVLEYVERERKNRTSDH